MTRKDWKDHDPGWPQDITWQELALLLGGTFAIVYIVGTLIDWAVSG